jgi:hypothetical protein
MNWTPFLILTIVGLQAATTASWLALCYHL